MMEHNYDVRTFDVEIPIEEYQKLPKRPLYVMLDHLRSAYNVGSIFRTADSARLEEIICVGYTAHPPHPKLAKTALGTEGYVKNSWFETAEEAVKYIKDKGIKILALETVNGAKNYTEYNYPEEVCIILGNEALGISDELLALADEIIEIPTFGYKNSLNVANAFGIVSYEILRQWGALKS